ncbi:hypothetical protein AMTRI_Chr10g224840 [Amborella trichopoda]
MNYVMISITCNGILGYARERFPSTLHYDFSFMASIKPLRFSIEDPSVTLLMASPLSFRTLSLIPSSPSNSSTLLFISSSENTPFSLAFSPIPTFHISTM